MKIPSLLLFISGCAFAQVYTPPPGTSPAPAAPAGGAEPSPLKPGSPGAMLRDDLPILDPSLSTLTVGGVAIPLGDSIVLRARFEKYLNQPEENSEAAEEYRGTVQEILSTVSPFHPGGPDLYAAFKKLPVASTYPGDANLCSSLAESIYMAMLSKQDVNGLNKLNKTIDDEKRKLIAETDFAARNDRDNSLGQKQKVGGKDDKKESGNKGAQTPGLGMNSLRAQDALRRITEMEVRMKENVVKTELQTIRTKTQYQVSMIQWFVQRRYEHVLMAARFYNQIWKDGDTELRIDPKSSVSKLFSESMGINPTVATLDSLSNEAIRETQKYIETVDLLLARGELHAASQRLMEGYALGEFLSPLATFPLEKKRKISDYVRDLHELQGSLNARDYTRTTVLADRLKESAKDFPASKVDSAIAAYTLASDLAIEEAKTHLLAKNTEKAAEKIKSATELWPTNPKLKEFSNLVTSSGGMNVARNDFDRLLGEGNYREIARRQYELAPAIQGDPSREDAFKQIVTNLTKIETALSKAGEFSKVGQNYAAWEQLAELREQFPDDPKLGREIELLAPKVADFTKALDEARKLEGRTPKQTGSALAWYLKAGDIYPNSAIAQAGIQRVLDDVLVDDGK